MILVIGKNSQTAKTLIELGFEAIYLSTQDLNLLNIDQISTKLSNYEFKIIINLAAYNNVEKAEDDENAFIVNHQAVAEISKFCKHNNCLLIHISSDYVFDGVNGSYTEEDLCNPINEYGKSKLFGEKAIRDILFEHVIIRTSWLYSHFNTPNNFLFKVKQLINSGKKISGADDVFGSPTSTLSLAKGILNVIDSYQNKQINYGTFHFADLGRVSRYKFIKEIALQYSLKNSLQLNTILTAKSSDFIMNAPRPLDTSLKSKKFMDMYNYTFREWDDCLIDVINKI